MPSNIPVNVAKHSGECHKTFQGMSPNIPRNVAKHSGEFRKTFRGMSQNILGNATKHSGKCRQIFRGLSSYIPGNVTKHSGECPSVVLLLYASSVATSKIHLAPGESNQHLCGDGSPPQTLCCKRLIGCPNTLL